MHVVLPEVDGRIFANAIAFKERSTPDEGGFAPTVSVPVADRIDATADLAAAWVRLRRAPPAERRVAIVLANYPNRDGRLANGVGLDTPESLAQVIEALRPRRLRRGRRPARGTALMRLLSHGPTNALAGRNAPSRRRRLAGVALRGGARRPAG